MGRHIDRVPGAKKAIDHLDKDKKLFSEVSERGKEMDACIICTEQFTDDAEVSELACNDKHIFHTGCISEWMKKSTTCPVCRQPVKTD